MKHRTKRCPKCTLTKTVREFHKGPNDGVQDWCKNCMNRASNDWHSRNRERGAKNRLASRHKMAPPELLELQTSQEFLCGICGKRKPLHVDHDHSCCLPGNSCTSCRRGLLCGDCNRGLGCFHDNVEYLANAISYLQKFKKGL